MNSEISLQRKHCYKLIMLIVECVQQCIVLHLTAMKHNSLVFGGYDVTPWNSILLQKVVVAHMVKKFPVFNGT
jgi:hypothetical protein